MPDRKGEEPMSTPASLLLYGAAGSGHSYKVRSLLLLTATPHRYQPIALDTPQAECPADFVAASHFGEGAGLAAEDFPCVSRWLNALRALPGWVHPNEAMASS